MGQDGSKPPSALRDYTGWMRRDVFSGPDTAALQVELERAQYDFLLGHRERMRPDGTLPLPDGIVMAGDALGGWSRQYEYAYVAANVDPQEVDVLDVGCGFSFFPHWLAERGHNVTCTDRIELGHAFTGTPVRFVRDDITRTELGGPYDCVYCLSVLEHIPDKAAAIEGLMRLTRPGGKLVLTLDCALDRRPGDSRPSSRSTGCSARSAGSSSAPASASPSSAPTT